MKCLNCGAELSEADKFCGACGTPISVDPQELVEDSVENIQSNEPSQQPNESGKKKSKKGLFIILGVAVAALIIAIAIILLNRTSGSIDKFEKAINNTIDSGKESGTVKASIELSGEDSTAFNISGTFKYEKSNDEYNFALETNQSLFMNAIKAYGNLKNEKMIFYVNNSLMDMITGSYSTDEVWLYQETDLSEITGDIENKEELKEEFNNFSLEESGLDKQIKFVGKNDGIEHYTLTIDKKYIDSLKSKINSKEKEQYEDLFDSFDDIDEILEKGYVIDFYVKNNKLQKISIDISKYLEESGINKAIISIEFIDFGSTKVEIPSEAKASTKTLEDYISENTTYYEDIDFDNTDDDFDF